MLSHDEHVRGDETPPEGPLPLYRVLEEEYAHLYPGATLSDMHGAAEASPPDERDKRRLQWAYGRMHQRELSALCLSGGGIRSASFALGVIQGLAQRGLLHRFDYLSTVSGGGFAGSWLTAWIHQALKDGDRDTVFRQLKDGEHLEGATEAPPVSRMRTYSRYMSPQLGALSADSWTLIATMLRNIFLNWMVLLPLLAAALLLPRAYLEAVQYFDRSLKPAVSYSLTDAPTVLLMASLGLLVISLSFVVADLPSYGDRRRTQAQFITWCLAPLCLGTIGLTIFWAVDVVAPSLRAFVITSVVVHTATWILVGLVTGRRKWRPRTWLAAAVSAPIIAVGIWWLTDGPFRSGVPLDRFYCTVAVPLALGFMGLTATVFVGLASDDANEDDLEWWSRYGAWLLIAALAWLACTLIVYYSPDVFRLVRDTIGDWFNISAAGATGAVGALASAVGTGAAMLLRQPTTAGASAKPSPFKSTILGLAPTLFVLVLLGALAWTNMALLNTLYKSELLAPLRVTPGSLHPDDVTIAEVLGLSVCLAALGLVMARYVPVNKFSLHGMYRQRLIRAFLGASRPPDTRAPNPFTGFEPKDNIAMAALRDIGKPLHVVNMTLNLLAEKTLATQFRRAESFTVTPLHTGSCRLNAYRPTREYANENIGGISGGMTLGTAVTISGAAASPNMGPRSSAPITFLMTMFNARLGIWLGNPGDVGENTWRSAEPRLGVGPLLRELFGQTTDKNPYIYLSDGGHFENLGLWEMVMRRCRYILVSDAGCDPQYRFEDLANAVRFVRMDLGIPIVFTEGIDIDRDRQGKGNPHYAVGRIQYSAIDGPLAADGILIYIKATVSGDEPVDVLNYAKASVEFPHESTANQWFTEAQFESYRMLGCASVSAIAHDDAGADGLRSFFEAAADGERRRRGASLAVGQLASTAGPDPHVAGYA